MTITIVCDVYGEENNGTVVAIMNLIRYLKNKNHTVRVLCADQSKKGQENFYVVPTLNFGKLLNSLVHKVGVTLAKADRAVIKEALNGTDHVHIILPLGLGNATAKIAHEMNLPITASFHMLAENLTCYIKLNKCRPINTFVYKWYNLLYRYKKFIRYRRFQYE